MSNKPYTSYDSKRRFLPLKCYNPKYPKIHVVEGDHTWDMAILGNWPLLAVARLRDGHVFKIGDYVNGWRGVFMGRIKEMRIQKGRVMVIAGKKSEVLKNLSHSKPGELWDSKKFLTREHALNDYLENVECLFTFTEIMELTKRDKKGIYGRILKKKVQQKLHEI